MKHENSVNYDILFHVLSDNDINDDSSANPNDKLLH